MPRSDGTTIEQLSGLTVFLDPVETKTQVNPPYGRFDMPAFTNEDPAWDTYCRPRGAFIFAYEHSFAMTNRRMDSPA